MSIQVVNVNKRPKLDLEEDEDEEEYFTCIICSEIWSNKGEHCLVSLKCGHLFGKKCIERWISDKTKKYGAKKAGCPICMKTAREADIRRVKPSKITVKDTSQSILMQKELESLKAKIKEAEKSIDLSLLALNLHKKELERAKEKRISRTDQPPVLDRVQNIPQPTLSRYSIITSKKLSENRHTARVMSINESSNTAFVSFKSSDTMHNILKLDLLDLIKVESIPVHDGLIRDIQHTNDFILSTSTDKTIKITSITTNKIEETITIPLPGWSCSIDETDNTKVYCGLADSSIMVYDLRNTKNALEKYQDSNIIKSPLHSMFIKNKNNIFCSNLNQAFIWDTINNTSHILDVSLDYKPYSFSRVNDSNDDSLLLSLRNSKSTKHQIISIDKDYHTNIISTYDSHLLQKSLTRTCAYNTNSLQNTMICYGDEANGMLRLINSNQEFQYFKIHSCPLDIKPFKDKKLAFLTDNRFFLLEPKHN